MINHAFTPLLESGLSVIPTREDKRPALNAWQAFQARRPTAAEAKDWAPAHGLGVICGPVSGNVFCIDLDQKNDPTKRLWAEYSDLVREQAPDLLARLVVESTPSGGFHVIARNAAAPRNVKLAKTKEHAVLIETRGDGGYFCAAPTPGYELKSGRLMAIPEITAEELEILLDCARALNQEEKEAPRPRSLPQGSTPFDEYDAKTSPEETAALMESHGWKIMSRRGEALYLRRPDKTGPAISATFNRIPGRLYVFTTSTLFESEHVYKPYAVYAMLEHNGDFKAAAAALRAKGYGAQEPTKPAAAPLVNREALAARIQYLYTHGMRKGEYCGWPALSKLYSVVKGQLNIVTGIPSHGKSEFTDALMVNLATKAGWNFVVYSPENYPTELHARKIIEKVSGKNFGGEGRITEQNLTSTTDWVLKHFTFIEPQEDEDVTLDSIFEVVREKQKTGTIDGVLIDPWNELESTRPDKITETDFIGLCLKRIRMFARRHDVAFWVVAHPAKMRKDQKTGEYPIPTLYDISGSANWYNKADNGIVVHRDFTNGQTEIIVQKMKFKYYGKTGSVIMKYDAVSGRYSELTLSDHFTPPPPRQLPPEDELE